MCSSLFSSSLLLSTRWYHLGLDIYICIYMHIYASICIYITVGYFHECSPFRWSTPDKRESINSAYTQYDTIGKTYATLQLLFHRAITSSLESDLQDRDRPTKRKFMWSGMFYQLCHRNCRRTCSPSYQKRANSPIVCRTTQTEPYPTLT
jgi:hypothetical protein